MTTVIPASPVVKNFKPIDQLARLGQYITSRKVGESVEREICVLDDFGNLLALDWTEGSTFDQHFEFFRDGFGSVDFYYVAEK